jgi:hypothetical protein
MVKIQAVTKTAKNLEKESHKTEQLSTLPECLALTG